MGNNMRYTPAEKMEIIRLVENSDLSISKTLDGLGVARTSFYRWYNSYVEQGGMMGYQDVGELPTGSGIKSQTLSGSGSGIFLCQMGMLINHPGN